MSRSNRSIVMVTPVALDRDSRALKMALSCVRAGWATTVMADRTVWDVEAIAKMGPRGPSGAMARNGRWWWKHASASSNNALQFLLFTAWLVRFAWYNLIVWTRLPRADVYYIHEFSQFPAVWLKQKTSPARVVYDAHDYYAGIEPEDAIPPLHRNYLFPFRSWLERRCAGKASIIITVSAGLARLLERRFERHALVVRNCHDGRLDRSVKKDLRARLGMLESDFLVVVVGNCKAGQALQQALEAWASLPERIHLAFVGDGYERIRGVVGDLNLGRRVHMLGPLHPLEIVPSIRSADAALILYYNRSESYAAALPNGFFQSVAAGLPLLLPALADMKAIVASEGLGLFIDPLDPEAIANAVLELAENDALRQEQASRSASLARTLSWEREEICLIKALAPLAMPNPAGNINTKCVE
jgi:glycosyltransferase involved in cell wall biosynthesis